MASDECQRELRITHVYSFANGQVVVFDQFGQQMPEYQGHYPDVIERIKADFDGPITFATWW